MIAIRPIIPVKFLKALEEGAMRDLLDREQADEALAVVRDLREYTSSWNHKPEFKERVTGLKRDVFTDDEVFRFVDQGTKAHIIRPRQARVLRFRHGTRSKTRPGVWGSGPGGGGGDVAFAHVVHHPGSEARHISRQAAERSRERYKRRMDKAFHDHFGR